MGCQSSKQNINHRIKKEDKILIKKVTVEGKTLRQQILQEQHRRKKQIQKQEEDQQMKFLSPLKSSVDHYTTKTTRQSNGEFEHQHQMMEAIKQQFVKQYSIKKSNSHQPKKVSFDANIQLLSKQNIENKEKQISVQTERSGEQKSKYFRKSNSQRDIV